MHDQHIYLNKQALRSCIYIYILAIAGQTAGPNRLKYFEETHGYPGRLGVIYFSKNYFFNI